MATRFYEEVENAATLSQTNANDLKNNLQQRLNDLPGEPAELNDLKTKIEPVVVPVGYTVVYKPKAPFTDEDFDALALIFPEINGRPI